MIGESVVAVNDAAPDAASNAVGAASSRAGQVIPVQASQALAE